MDTLAGHSASTPDRRWIHGLAASGLLCVGGLLHLWYLIDHCPLDLSGDEAHYWEWSRRLDLSYYSKGPLVAYILALGRLLLADWSLHVVGNEVLAVRVPAIVLSIGTGLGIYTLASQTLGRSRPALAAVALTFTIPILAVGAVMMTIDAPLAFCYVWALAAAHRGLLGRGTWPWLIVGVLSALGILAKYTMVLIFPAVGLALLTEPSFRANLRRAGPYLATVIGALGFVPILIWNARHNWVSFRHVAGQAGVAGQTSFDPAGVIDFFTGQLAVVSPVWLIALIAAVVSVCRNPCPRPTENHVSAAGLKLLLCATLTPWVVFLAFSPLTKVQPNWPVLALLPGAILVVFWIAGLLRRPSARARRGARLLVGAGIVLGGALVLVAHWTEPLLPAFDWLTRGSPPLGLTRRAPAWELTPIAKYDPTARLRGWGQLGSAVGRVRAAEHAAGRQPFIITDDYRVASEIAFYCPGQPAVYCLQAVLGRRQSQYDLWRPNPVRDPAEFIGRPCLYIGSLKPELIGQGGFGHVALRGELQTETVEHRVRGYLMQIWAIRVYQEFAGLPPELPTRATGKF